MIAWVIMAACHVVFDAQDSLDVFAYANMSPIFFPRLFAQEER